MKIRPLLACVAVVMAGCSAPERQQANETSTPTAQSDAGDQALRNADRLIADAKAREASLNAAEQELAGRRGPAVDSAPKGRPGSQRFPTASTSAPSSSLSSSAPVDPQPKTTVEKMRERAVAEFGTRLSRLSERISANLSAIDRARAVCEGFSQGRSRGVIAVPNVFTPGGYDELETSGGVSIDNSTTPECLGLNHDASVQTQAILGEVDDINEGARQLGLYPGVMRDLFAEFLGSAR